MKVLVTGACGGIGRHTVARLSGSGFDVVGFVRPNDACSDDGQFIRGDCRDARLMRDAVVGVDAIVHLAAIPSPVSADPEVVFSNNVLATYVVLECAAEAGVRRGVIASSISVLGLAWAPKPLSPLYVPVDEVHPIMAMESYALSKQIDEATAAMISRRYGMTIIALRFPYTAPREHVLSRAAQVREAPQCAAAELWAYLDVADAAAAIQAALEAPADGCHVVNVTAPDTLASPPTMELMKSFHPSTLIKTPLPGRSTAYDLDRMSHLLRFQPSSVGIAT